MCHIQNPGLFRTSWVLESSSKACQICKMIMHIQSPSIIRTVCSSIFRVFRLAQGYWYIFSHIHRTHRCATGGIRGGPPLLFLKSKKCPDFEKKGLDCVEFKFAIQNVVLRLFRTKIPKCFPVAPLALVLQPSPSALKNFWLSTCTQVLFF